MAEIIELRMKFYLVQNQDGHFFRAKGRDGGGLSWVSEATDARIYTRIGQARSRVTFFSKHYPKYGIPRIIEIEVGQGIVLVEEVRVKKAIAKKEKAELEEKQRFLLVQQQHLNEKQRALDSERAKLLKKIISS